MQQGIAAFKRSKIEADARMQQAIAAFKHSSTSSCRLVHYTGVDKPAAMDVDAGEVEAEIAGCVNEGFYVDCFYERGRLFILVQEPDCPIPSWEQVKAEAAMVDVDALLEAARQRGEL